MRRASSSPSARAARRRPTRSRPAARRSHESCRLAREFPRACDKWLPIRAQRPARPQAREGCRVMDPVQRRPHPLVVRPRLDASVPWPGAGTKSSGVAVALSPSRSSPAAASTMRVGLAGVELAQPRVDVAAQLDHLEVGPDGRAAAPGGAASWSRPGRPRAPRVVRPPRPRRTITSRALARGGVATSAQPSASSPGTSLAECTARSISPATSAASIASTQRDLSPTAARLVARGADLDDLRVLEPVGHPARLGERERAAAGADPQRRQLASRRRSGRTSPPVGPLGRRRARRARTARAAAGGARDGARRRAGGRAAWARGAAG